MIQYSKQVNECLDTGTADLTAKSVELRNRYLSGKNNIAGRAFTPKKAAAMLALIEEIKDLAQSLEYSFQSND